MYKYLFWGTTLKAIYHLLFYCFILNVKQKKLESILEEKQEENGDAFDREAYLRNEEQFQDVEIVVPGRTVSNINRKHVSSDDQ